MGGPSGESSSTPQALRKRAFPAQWALYGPTAALGLQRAYGSPFEYQKNLTDLTGQITQNAAGAQSRLGSTLAGHGIDLTSPLYAGASRGIETQQMSDLAGAAGMAKNLQQSEQQKYYQMISQMVGAQPPGNQISQAQQKGGK